MSSSGIVGQVLDGKYDIEKQLGKGGMGTVYLATHIGTGRPVAVKVIAPDFMKRAEFVERFRREARAAGRLRHPNVVDVTDFGFAKTECGDDVAYLVMEYLDGCTLGEVLDEEGCLPVEFSIDILEQVCSAVEEAHKQGIIHRDLKPDNIWLEPNQRGGYTVKVLDFGIAKLEETHFLDLQNTPESIPKPNSQTKLVSEKNTVVDDSQTETISDKKTDTLITEGETVALVEESKTLVADKSEAGTIIQNEESASEEVDTEGGTAILPANKTLDTNEEDNKGTRLITEKDKTNKSPQTTDLTRVGAVLGTPLYMSPEQCRGKKLTARSDIYSLAVICYQMLSGRLPFDGDYMKVMEGHKNQEPPPLVAKKVPKKLKQIVMQSLSKDTEERPQNAEAFASKLRSNSEGLGAILRRAVVIYGERLPNFLLLATIIFAPLLIATLLRVVFRFLTAFQVIEGVASVSINIFFGVFTFFLQIVSAAFLVGMITWVVAQTLAFPLRPISLRSAFKEVKSRWRTLTGTVTVSTLLAMLGFVLCILPGIFISARYMLIAPSVMMEGVKGRAAFRRSVELTKRSFLTVFATSLLIYIVPMVIAGFLAFSIGSALGVYNLSQANKELKKEIAQMKKDGVEPQKEDSKEKKKNNSNFTVSVNNKGVSVTTGKTKEERSMTRKITASLQEGIFEIIWTPLALLISSFTSVITALIYFKTRQAGGESMQELLGKLETDDQPQSKWQQRVRERLIQSGKLTGTSPSNVSNPTNS